MPSAAFVIAGLSGRALAAARLAIERRFPDAVVRGNAMPLQRDGIARYSGPLIAAAVDAAADAVFGTSRRANAFCRNPQRSCHEAGRVHRMTCGKVSGQTCSLVAPDRLIVLLQAGEEEGELRHAFYHAPWFVRVPSDCHDRPQEAANVYTDAAATADRACAALRHKVVERGAGLLLPPAAFGRGGTVTRLLRDVNAAPADGLQIVTRFRRGWFRRDRRAYVGDHDAPFEPADRSAYHGGAGGETDDPRLALSRYYRLGVRIEEGFHWDVQPPDGRRFPGTFAYVCRQYGARPARGTHVNVWPADWLGPPD